MSVDRHVLIDGYNVLFAWPKAQRMLKNNIDVARTRLIDQLRVLYASGDTRITIVFDGKGQRIEVERPTGEQGFSVVFSSSDTSADSVIEHIVQKADPSTELTVYSRDNMVASAVRAYGGFLLPPEALWEWVGRCERDQDVALQRHRREEHKRWKKSDIWKGI